MTTENDGRTGGHTPLTPPPAAAALSATAAANAAPPTPPVPPSAAPADGGVGRTSGAKALTVITAVVGGLALLGAGGTAAAAAVGDLSRTNSEQSVNVDGIDTLDLDASASTVTVRFSDTDDAVLTVAGGRGDWTMERENGELVVRSPRAFLPWWFGGTWFGGEERVVLTLPESLQSSSLDARLSLSAGDLDVEGEFGELAIDLGAGSVVADGSATSLTVDMSAGRSDMEFDGVSEADISVSAGNMDLVLTGEAPDTIGIDVSAGSLSIVVPDAEYNVLQDVSAGSLDSRVDESTNASRTIDVSLSAGDVKLRPGN